MTSRPIQFKESTRSKNQDFRVLMRIYAHTNDLNVNLTKQVLQLAEGDERIVNRYHDQSEGIAGWEFANSPPSKSVGQIGEGQQTAFLNASRWFQDKAPSLFQQFRELGNKADLCVMGYTGPIPEGLIRELGRLGLELYIVS